MVDHARYYESARDGFTLFVRSGRPDWRQPQIGALGASPHIGHFPWQNRLLHQCLLGPARQPWRSPHRT